jgi:hypothetical protein
VEILQGEEFYRLFYTFKHRAFHIEVKDSYQTPDEAGPFDLFLSGAYDDFAWHQPWLNLLRRVAREGREMDRVRVVTVPHGDYTRWGLAVAPLNITAGEDIRWLPRHLITAADLPADDYWLFDNDLVVFTVFEPGGRFVGGATTVDKKIIEHCRAARDHVWNVAIPHSEYIVSEYVAT